MLNGKTHYNWQIVYSYVSHYQRIYLFDIGIYIYVYIYMYIYICICIYMYIYTMWNPQDIADSVQLVNSSLQIHVWIDGSFIVR